MQIIKTLTSATVLFLGNLAPAFAQDMGHDMAKEHGGAIHHMFRV